MFRKLKKWYQIEKRAFEFEAYHAKLENRKWTILDHCWDYVKYLKCRIRGHEMEEIGGSAEYGSAEFECKNCGHFEKGYW